MGGVAPGRPHPALGGCADLALQAVFCVICCWSLRFDAELLQVGWWQWPRQRPNGRAAEEQAQWEQLRSKRPNGSSCRRAADNAEEEAQWEQLRGMRVRQNLEALEMWRSSPRQSRSLHSLPLLASARLAAMMSFCVDLVILHFRVASLGAAFGLVG